MRKLINVGCSLILLSLLTTCNSQTNNPINEITRPSSNAIVGGPFENAEFMYIGKPDLIDAVDTSGGWDQEGQKILITGTIYKVDGKTPAPNVLLYYYHTDINGLYTMKEELDARVRRHGYIRGWVKSDQNGKYSIYTVRPAPYPNSQEPAHIHPSIKEPNIKKEYYIDEFVFEDDPLLTKAKIKAMNNRGGSGVLIFSKSGDLQIAEKDIVLGLNIPNYPEGGSQE